MSEHMPQPFMRSSTTDAGHEVLIVALPEEPREMWTFAVKFHGSEPFFTYLNYAAAHPDRTTVHRRATTFHPPAARLVGIWCLWRGLDIDGTPSSSDRSLWDGVMPGAVAGFSRAPDPRPLGGESTAEYAAAMHDWTEPIADTLDLASTVGLSDVRAVELRFGVSRSVAKKHVTRARRYNRRYAPKPISLSTGRPNGGTSKTSGSKPGEQ